MALSAISEPDGVLIQFCLRKVDSRGRAKTLIAIFN